MLLGEFIELAKLLKASALCASGGRAKYAIEQGRVTVDGEVEYRKGCKIRRGQTIEFEGRSIQVA